MPTFENAYAKVNLILDVLGKRADGFHEIRTIFQSLSLSDRLTFSDNQDGDISLTCNIPELPCDFQNLAWRAANLLKEQYSVSQGVHITLEKQIPVAAGLGGGSADAAAVLRGLTRFWGLSVNTEELLALAAKLGSDVPFCLMGGTALGKGRGELVEALPPCPYYYVVLANPGFPVSTAMVYQNLCENMFQIRPDTEGMIQAIGRLDSSGVISRLGNVLEESTFALYPAVNELKERMSQHGPSLMCGSGATVFTLFSEKAAAKHLHKVLLAEGKDAWMTETYNGAEGGE
jgi:4-diphosphocytidyl-2-C-methyl-D-erythritol kinase